MEVSLAVKPRGRQESAGRRLGPGWERRMPVQASRVGLAVFMGPPGMIRLVISVDGKGSPSVMEKIQMHRKVTCVLIKLPALPGTPLFSGVLSVVIHKSCAFYQN